MFHGNGKRHTNAQAHVTGRSVTDSWWQWQLSLALEPFCCQPLTEQAQVFGAWWESVPEGTHLMFCCIKTKCMFPLIDTVCQYKYKMCCGNVFFQLQQNYSCLCGFMFAVPTFTLSADSVQFSRVSSSQVVHSIPWGGDYTDTITTWFSRLMPSPSKFP